MAGENTSRNLLLDETGDLDLAGGQLNFARGLQAVKQSIRTRLGLWAGEWFLDLDDGVDYRGTVFVKNPSFIAVRASFRDRILETPGVGELRSFSMSYEPGLRGLTVTYEVTAQLDELSQTAAIVADIFTLET